MKYIITTATTIILVMLVLISFGQEATFNYTRDFKTILAQTKDPNSDLFYDKLLKRFEDDDTTITRPEALALLIGFTDKPAYKPYNILETERLIYSLNDEGKFKEAHDTASLLLKTYPLSFQALKEMSYACEKLGLPDSANLYLNHVARIMRGMMYSGSGKTPETAMFALGPADGQHLLLGAGAGLGIMGSGSDKDGNFLDILQAILPDGTKVNVYFNIQHATLKMFDGKSVHEYLQDQQKGARKKATK